MAETQENPRVTGLLAWTRVILPIALAGLGWYIGQTVGAVNKDIEDIRSADKNLREEFVIHQASMNVVRDHILKRLDNQEITMQDFVEMSDYLIKENADTRRIERLEDRLDGKK